MQRDLVAKAPAQQSEDAANTAKCCLKIRRVARWHKGPSANEAKTATKTAAESTSSWCDVARYSTRVVDIHLESDGNALAEHKVLPRTQVPPIEIEPSAWRAYSPGHGQSSFHLLWQRIRNIGREEAFIPIHSAPPLTFASQETP